MPEKNGFHDQIDDCQKNSHLHGQLSIAVLYFSGMYEGVGCKWCPEAKNSEYRVSLFLQRASSSSGGWATPRWREKTFEKC